MFGKKIPNPEIEKLEKEFKDRIMVVKNIYMESSVLFDLEGFKEIAKSCPEYTIFKRTSYYSTIFAIISASGVGYWLEIDTLVRK